MKIRGFDLNKPIEKSISAALNLKRFKNCLTSYQRFAKVMRLSLKKRQAQNLENQRSNNTQTLKILLIKRFSEVFR